MIDTGDSNPLLPVEEERFTFHFILAIHFKRMSAIES